jgi:2-oxo-4-hydroxy-4-carboxy-5-ureidoimidazoline decarboxylase
MNGVLEAWNAASEAEAQDAMLACCGARRWAASMVALRPIASVIALSALADREWSRMEESDWLEAFACHPRIGERSPQRTAHASSKSAAWSSQEQASAAIAEDRILAGIAKGNEAYEQRFGFTYIVCATGKTAEEMLAILTQRLKNDRAAELREAAEQQRQILQIRLGKWLAE